MSLSISNHLTISQSQWISRLALLTLCLLVMSAAGNSDPGRSSNNKEDWYVRWRLQGKGHESYYFKASESLKAASKAPHDVYMYVDGTAVDSIVVGANYTLNAEKMALLRTNGELAHVAIDYREPDEAVKTNALLRGIIAADGQTRDVVRQVTVTGSTGLGDWELVEKFLATVSGLETVQWNNEQGFIPAGVVEVLNEKHPACKLHYTLLHDMPDRWHPDGREKRPGRGNGRLYERKSGREPLVNAKGLYSLQRKINYGGYAEAEDMNLVLRALLNSPALRELDLTVERYGCIANPANKFAFDFSAAPSPKFPPLEVLSLKGYNFAATPDGKRRPWVVKDGKHGPPDSAAWNDNSLDLWLQAMDWSQLHTLKLSSPASWMLKRIQDHVPNLQNITFTGGNGTEILEFFTELSQPLISIALRDVEFSSFDPVVATLSGPKGKALQALEIRQTESAHSVNTGISNFFTEEQLAQLRNSCPSIATLDIGVNRRHEVPETLIDTLASFPSLRHLTLRFESPLLSTDADTGPHRLSAFDRRDEAEEVAIREDTLISQDQIESVFRQFRQKMPHRELATLEYVSGPFESKPAGMVGWFPKRVGRIKAWVASDGTIESKGGQLVRSGQTWERDPPPKAREEPTAKEAAPAAKRSDGKKPYQTVDVGSYIYVVPDDDGKI